MQWMDLTARDRGVRAALKRTADWANGLAACVGVLGVVGWSADLSILRTFGAAFPSLSLATACCLLIAAGALAAGQNSGPRADRGVRAAAVVIALMAGLTLVGHATGMTVGMDLGFTGLARSAEEPPHPMSIPKALAFIAAAVGIALVPVRTPAAAKVNLGIAIGVMAMAFIALVGLTFRVLLFHAAAPLLGMALPAAIAFLLLGISLLAGRPDPWLVSVLTSDRPGAVMTRWLLPAAVGVPLAAGWARMLGERYGLLDEPLGAGLLTLLMIAVLAALTLWIADALDQMDLRRRRAEEEAREAYAELDRRVIDRTAALERATATVRERTALLGTITASTPDLIWAKDLEDRILTVNPAWLKAMGKEEREVMGRSALELVADPEAARRVAESDRLVVESGKSSVVEEVFSGSGGPRIYLTTKSPLRDENGRTVGLIGVATDITERKRAERELEALVATEQRLRAEAERANRAKDEFLAIVSHELRSPLNALRGWGHLLANTRPLDAGLIDRATKAIKRNVDHQARLIGDLLDTSRLISGKLTLERQPLNLVDVVHAALEVVRPAATAKRIALDAAFDHPVVTVDGDAGRLQQVVTNLLSNAVKFTPEHGVVETSVRLAGDRVRLAVRDNGVGIAPDFLPHVFDRFSQADTSTTRRAGGLGIGLALVRHLVELHGGAARAESRGAGQGATFTVELPAPATGAWAVRAPASASDARLTSAGLNDLSIYVVDDDADAREIVGFALRQAGATVETFASGRELAARLEGTAAAARPDILLLDLAMPGEDGFAVLARVRSIEAESGIGPQDSIPAIAVTAFTAVDRPRLAAAGFRDLVGKPIHADHLVATIRAVLEPRGRGGAAPATRVASARSWSPSSG